MGVRMRSSYRVIKPQVSPAPNSRCQDTETPALALWSITLLKALLRFWIYQHSICCAGEPAQFALREGQRTVTLPSATCPWPGSRTPELTLRVGFLGAVPRWTRCQATPTCCVFLRTPLNSDLCNGSDERAVSITLADEINDLVRDLLDGVPIITDVFSGLARGKPVSLQHQEHIMVAFIQNSLISHLHNAPPHPPASVYLAPF